LGRGSKEGRNGHVRRGRGGGGTCDAVEDEGLCAGVAEFEGVNEWGN
jgi:hypothetical protein